MCPHPPVYTCGCIQQEKEKERKEEKDDDVEKAELRRREGKERVRGGRG